MLKLKTILIFLSFISIFLFACNTPNEVSKEELTSMLANKKIESLTYKNKKTLYSKFKDGTEVMTQLSAKEVIMIQKQLSDPSIYQSDLYHQN